MDIKVITDSQLKEAIAREVLSDLPEGFGLPDSTEEYIRKSKEMPLWRSIKIL